MHLLHMFHGGQVELERINRSYMVLLPKKPAAASIGDYRPICLQNCSVKIISKVLTSRLQREIQSLVDIDQTGFLKGRSISENFVYAMELVQCCHRRRNPTLVLKLDFAKAFDTVHWDGLQAVLRARGFSDRWRGWVQELLRTSKTAVLLNGCPGPWISCARGLRQGDPMSPYLFLLVADVLQSLIKREQVIRHPAVDGAPCAVLQYADDTLLVLRGELEGVKRLKQVLDTFSQATGLCINFHKSVMVPMHMEEQVVHQCVAELGCKQEGFPQTYLGLPLSSTKLRLSAFAPLIAKADKYLAGWQAALLNPMGRLVLVNTVLDSQLVYAMSVMQLQPGVIKAVNKKRRGFLWAGEKEASGARCLVAWDDVCLDKAAGGLGVKDLQTQNTCLMLKLLHRLHTATTSSWARWARERVCMATMEGSIEGEHWIALRALLPLYRAITTCSVVSGRDTSFWSDAWLGEDDLATRFPMLFSHVKNAEASVRDVVEAGVEPCLVPRLTPQAREELRELQAALSQVTLQEGGDQRYCPMADENNKLLSKPLYQVLRARSDNMDARAAFVWESRAPPRVQFFGWLVNRSRLQCRANLARRKIVPDDRCEVCGESTETTAHILLQCEFAARFWEELGMDISSSDTDSVLLRISRPQAMPEKHFSTFILLCCWELWKRRNNVVFRGERATIQETLRACRADVELWKHRLRQEDRWVVAAWCARLHNG